MLRSHLSVLLACCLAAGLSSALCSSSRADQVDSPKLPKSKPSAAGVFYPEKARRLNQQGRVLVEFAVSSKGRVVDTAIVSSEPRGAFEDAVKAYMKSVEFDVPRDWEASGGSQHKYHFSFVFILRPCRETVPCEEPAPFEADGAIKVTGSSLPPPPTH
jgi:TonB family protein